MDTNMVGIIIAIVGTWATLVGTVILMMFWVRQETTMLREEAKENRKDFLQINRNLENVMVSMSREMKEFHIRLIDIDMELRHDIRMQSERSDKLYTMFIDLLKEQKAK